MMQDGIGGANGDDQPRPQRSLCGARTSSCSVQTGFLAKGLELNTFKQRNVHDLIYCSFRRRQKWISLRRHGVNFKRCTSTHGTCSSFTSPTYPAELQLQPGFTPKASPEFDGGW